MLIDFLIEHCFLCSIGQIFFNPEVGAGSNTVMVYNLWRLIVGDSVESLREI